MMVNLKTTIEINSNDGELKIVSSISKKIPDFKDFEAQGFATAFNSLEMAGMSSAKEGLENTMSEYLEEGSRQKSTQEGEALGLQNLGRIEDKYVIESVVGTVETTSLRLVDGDTTVSNTASTFFAPKQPCERWYSNHFNELAYDAARHMSDRAAADFLNKIRCQETGVIPTTLRNHVERDGRNIGKAIPKKSNAGIVSAGFDLKTPEAPKDAATLIPEKTHVDPALVAKAAWRLGIEGHDARAFEASGQTASVSIDEVQVKAQKDARPMPDGKEK